MIIIPCSLLLVLTRYSNTIITVTSYSSRTQCSILPVAAYLLLCNCCYFYYTPTIRYMAHVVLVVHFGNLIMTIIHYCHHTSFFTIINCWLVLYLLFLAMKKYNSAILCRTDVGIARIFRVFSVERFQYCSNLIGCSINCFLLIKAIMNNLKGNN